MGPVLHGSVAVFRDSMKGRRPVVMREDDEGFNLQSLQAIVGHDPVATPKVIPLSAEESLRISGQFIPTFYYYQMAILDTVGEDREIREFNSFRWALIPKGDEYRMAEVPEDLKFALGFQLPYRTKRRVYAVGLRFAKNLEEHWRVRGSVGQYLVYERL
jgi:hypothetical protein